MTEVFDAILKASFQGSIVILAVLVLRLLLKRAPKSLFCLLWLLAGLRLALPFEIQSSLSLQPNYSFSAETVSGEEVSVREEILDRNGPVLVGQEQAVPPVQITTPPETQGENIQTETFIYKVKDGTITGLLTWKDVATQVWLLGMGIMLCASALSYWKLRHRVREAYLVEKGCYECPGLETAFVLGFFPAKIYLPLGLSDREKAFIYDHENTHIARQDHWFKLLGYGVLSIHWFNPLVWLGYGLLCRDMELACDEHVVRNMTLPERKAYSAALLSCGSHTARIAACPVAFGESNPRKRIMNVLNYKKPTFWISLLAVAAVIFVSVCLLTSPKEGKPLERLTQALEDYQSRGSWHIQTEYTYEDRPAATRCEMDIWQEEDRWYRVNSMELADGNQQTRGYLSEQDIQYTFSVSGVYHPEYRRWSLAEEDQQSYPYWLPRFELKEDDIAEIREEKTEEGSIITTVMDTAAAGEQYTQLYIRWHLDKKGNLAHVERYEQFTTTEEGETFLMGIQMDIFLLDTEAEEIAGVINNALEEIPEAIRQKPQTMVWNLEMKATDVTPGGMTVEFIQNGPFEGYDRAELQFGTYYTLEKWVDGSWEPVEMLPQEYEVGWTTEAYLIKRDDTTSQRILWDWLYGELTGGTYRIGKNVDLVRGTGNLETAWFYAEFTIEGTDQPGSINMTGEEYLIMCRDAVAELQSREQFHISETLVYYNGETEDSRSNVVFWRDGENWLRESYMTRMQQNRNLLYYDGLMYMQWQKDGEEAVWDLVDSADGDLQGMTWLHWLRWDSQNVTFMEISQEADELCVSVVVSATPPTLGWEDVQEYGIRFWFDTSGNLTRAVMNASRGNIRVEDGLTIETTIVDFIHNKLENVAAQLFPETCIGLPLADEAYLEKCREALEAYQSQGVWAIQAESSFWGQGALSSSSVSQWFGYGEDYLKWAAIPEDTHDSVWWDLRMNGETYHRQGRIGENGEESASPWEKGTTDNQAVYPHWPLRYDWEDGDVRFQEQGTEDSMDYVTVTIQGSPFPEYPDPIREYTVTFFFLQDLLQSVELTYERTDSMGGCTRRYDLYAFAPGVSVNKISQYYEEAQAQTGGIKEE